jgi:anti-sigma B factor antagonist
MTVSERQVGNVIVIDVDGSLTLGDAADALRDKVRSLLQQGEKRLIVNLARVSYMDSSGLGELVAAFATASRQGGALKLVNLTKRLHDLLVITKLSNVFECFDDEATAVGSFGAAA